MGVFEIGNPIESPGRVNAVLTPPLSIDGVPSYGEQKQQNFLGRLLNLFKAVTPGTDLAKFQLPPQFNLPKSQLQLFGESVYCYSHDLLSKCAQGKTALERFNAVVAWSISTNRPPVFGKAPYNPILGETHHVSSGNLNVLLEQVSHHPPVTALHATNEAQNVELNWWQNPQSKFYGRSVEATIHGQRELKLLEFNESYEMNCPKLCITFFPFPTVEWSGNVEIQCRQSGLKATLSYTGKSLFGLRGSSSRIIGRIGHCSPAQDIYELEGNWDGIVTVKDISTGKKSILYDAREVISNLEGPVVEDEQGLEQTESAIVWSEVSEGILKGDWNRARQAKRRVEEEQRNLRKERASAGMTWSPKHFVRRGDGWDYLHCPRVVPPAPIVVP
uniref:TSA: Wollemia nobilis Ref_Wollemi_Transcript_28256_1848 transcribed RNA sequence n=1 Tax=Wollemia nobilis TaxID=56998 RepID=A0A0C9QLL2_9CONI